MIYLILFIIAIILILLIYFSMKHLKIGCVTFVTGGIKTGKSSLCVHLAIKQYKKNLLKVKIGNVFRRIFRKKQRELPLLYSNIPLNVPYVPVTQEILLRQQRLRYKSVTLLNEASLIANSMLIKDKDVNNELSLFFKLYGHETHSGHIFIDSQCVADTHYSIKRVLNNYLNIIHAIKLPFFVLLRVREMLYTDDGNAINTITSDIDDSTLWLLYPKSVWKRFDAHTFSASTDKLPIAKCVVKKHLKKYKDLKTYKLSSFNKDYINYYEEGVNYETKND